MEAYWNLEELGYESLIDSCVNDTLRPSVIPLTKGSGMLGEGGKTTPPFGNRISGKWRRFISPKSTRIGQNSNWPKLEIWVLYIYVLIFRNILNRLNPSFDLWDVTKTPQPRKSANILLWFNIFHFVLRSPMLTSIDILSCTFKR